MYLMISGVLFLLFVGNILMGSLGGSAFLGDISEMLLLAAVSVFFVAAVLKARREELESDSNN